MYRGPKPPEYLFTNRKTTELTNKLLHLLMPSSFHSRCCRRHKVPDSLTYPAAAGRGFRESAHQKTPAPLVVAILFKTSSWAFTRMISVLDCTGILLWPVLAGYATQLRKQTGDMRKITLVPGFCKRYRPLSRRAKTSSTLKSAGTARKVRQGLAGF